ncbi:MAG: alpha/beta hydrolase [Methylocystis sp.]
MPDLVATPRNPVPPNARTYVLTAADHVSLRMARFSPPGVPRATLALFQGRAEFIEKYFETIGELLHRGFEVVTLDWRGQGGSERELANPRKGHVDDFAQYQRDLAAFVAQMARLALPKPWFALAHSMGGAILLEYAHGGGVEFGRLVATAPMIDIHGLRFPRGARFLANSLDMLGLGAMFVPGGGEASLAELKFEGNILTSDPARLARNAAVLAEAPRLGIGDPTIGWTNAAFRQMRRFTEPDYAHRWTVPTLLIASGRDTLVSTRAIERFAQRLDIASLVTIPGARHEVMMERDDLRALFFSAFDAFIPGSAAEGAIVRVAE